MSLSRKQFIQNAGLAAAGALLSRLPLQALASTPNKSPKPFGIQVYSVKEAMQQDVRGTLNLLASFGYRQIESFEGPKGMFWGMDNSFSLFVSDYCGMKLVASHCDVFTGLEQKAAKAAKAGMQYLICPWLGPQKSIDDFRRFADRFNQVGEICRKNGLRFAYHNHDYSFKLLDGQIPQQVLMENTDPGLVDFEMDMYWVVTAGENPESWLKKHPGRFRLCHIKDRMKQPLTDNKNSSCVLGTGVIPFPGILKTARDNGMQYYIAEQEYYGNISTMKATRLNAGYLRRLIRWLY